jgi:radical SAM superfamily enzyme with C-terminal helix-hairpin-helix motif
MLKTTILDGYIDEPTCLGVPPYISPYPRYISGAIKLHDKKNIVNYLTIDQVRQNPENIDFLSQNDLLIVIAGTSVPGKYLSGYPASPNELKKILEKLPVKKILTGPAAKHGFGIQGGRATRDISFLKNIFHLIVPGDAEVVIHNYLENNLRPYNIDTEEKRKKAHNIRAYANLGSSIVKNHPNYPDYLICEIETYRGCPRAIVGGCSFCSEPGKGLPDFRPIDDIVEEIRCLYNNGIKHFRLGSQPCIFSYQSIDAGEKEFPRPNPDALEELFSKIRKVAPALLTLHIDNANPGVIARYPKESKNIAKTIVKYHTAGDVAAMGVESIDPEVIKKNNLKASEDEVLDAIKIINSVGAKRGSNGLPELLPGLNFVFGLTGETKKTFEMNFNFLKKILNSDLLLRRINLRQVIPIPETEMYKTGTRLVNRHKPLFKHFKYKVSTEIERPMLKKIVPPGTVLKNVYLEKQDGKTVFARQLGSYPLLIGIPGVTDLNKFIDVKITDYGYRSITGIPYPLEINTASRETLESIAGLGKKRVIRLLAGRPFKTKEEILKSLDDKTVADEFLKFIQ